MLSPETWKWLETYKEFITNGLPIAAVAFAIIIEFLRALASPVEPAVARTGDWMVRNAFMLGVVMFFISRATAFAIAAHQVLAPG
jgi:hypothetical protein